MCRARHSRTPSTRTSPRAATCWRRRWPGMGLSPDQVAVLSAATELDESAMAVVTVIDHGIQDHFHTDVISVIDSDLRPHHDQPHDRARRNPLDKRLAHHRRRSATRPRQVTQRGKGAGSARHAITTTANAKKCTDEGRLRSPNLRLDGTGPASKVLSHGFESGQRTSGVGALFLEPAKRRSAVASRCANGVRPGAASARIVDSRLHFRAPRGGADVRPVLVQARRTGRPVGDPRRPRHRRDLRPRRRPAASGGQSHQRAPHRRSVEQPHLRQGQRARQVPAGPVGRHRGRARRPCRCARPTVRSGRSATAHPTSRTPLPS